MTDYSENILRGARIRLDALTDADLATITGWHQDAGFMRLLDSRTAHPHTADELRASFREMQQSPTDFLFAIRPLDDNTIIGWLELDGIQWAHRTGGLGIGIGNPAYRSKGYGTEACQLALRFAFEELNLHRITVTVFSYNAASLGMIEKLGFVREGTFREFLERSGQRHDMILFGMLRPEWLARQTSNPT